MTIKPAALALTTLALSAAALGCGGDDEEPLSKAEFIKQGDAICKKSGDKVDAAAEKQFADLGRGETPSPSEIEAFAEETLVPEVSGQLEDLRELPAPEGDEDRVNEIFDAAEEALGKVEDDPAVLLEQGGDPFESANELASDYGFKECGE